MIYYVDPKLGNDERSGQSEAMAWRSIAQVNSIVAAGDTVIFLGNETIISDEPFDPINEGTKQNPIVFKCKDGEQTTLAQGSYNSEHGITGYNGCSIRLDDTGSNSQAYRKYYTFDGFKIVNAYWGSLMGCEGIVIKNCDCSHYDGIDEYYGGPYWGVFGFKMRNSTYCIFENNKLTGTQIGASEDVLLFERKCHHNLIQNNILVNAGHCNIYISGLDAWEYTNPLISNSARFNVIKNNYFYNEFHQNINIHLSPYHTLVEGNFFEQAGSGTQKGTKTKYGLFGNELSCSSYSKETNGIYRKNIIRRGGSADDYNHLGAIENVAYNASGNSNSINNRIYNNVFYNNYGLAISGGLSIHSAQSTYPEYKDHIIKNNIFYKNGEGITYPHPDGEPQYSNEFEDFIIYYQISGNPHPHWADINDKWENNLIETTSRNTILVKGNGTPRSLAECKNGLNELPNLKFNSENIQGNPYFKNPEPPYNKYDINSIKQKFSIQSVSPCINAGAFLTTCNGSGNNSNLVTVFDPYYFAGGSNPNNWDGIIDGDTIQIGSEIVQITSIDYDTKQLTLDRAISWSNGENVSFPYKGTKPDMGIAEYEVTEVTPPTATTLNASSVNQTNATLNASIIPNGLETSYYFEYGEDTNYGNTTASKSAGSETTSIDVSELLEHLNDNTTYHYRIVAINSEGTSYGLDASFLTIAKPVEDGLYKINLKRNLAVGAISFLLKFFYSEQEGTEEHVLLDFDTFNVGNDDISDIIYYPGNFKLKLKVNGDTNKWIAIYRDLLNVTCVVDVFDGNKHIWSGYVDKDDVNGNSFTKTLEFTTLDQMKRLENYKPSENPFNYNLNNFGKVIDIIKDILTSDNFFQFPYISEVVYLGKMEARYDNGGNWIYKPFEDFYTEYNYYYNSNVGYENVLQLLKQILLNYNCIGVIGFDKKFYMIPRVAENPDVITITREMLNSYPEWERVYRMRGLKAKLGTGTVGVYHEELRGDTESESKRKVENITIEQPGGNWRIEGSGISGYSGVYLNIGGVLAATKLHDKSFRTKDKNGNYTEWKSLWSIPVDTTWDLIKFDRQKVKVKITGNYNTVPIWKCYKLEGIDMVFRAAKGSYDFKKKEVTLVLMQTTKHEAN